MNDMHLSSKIGHADIKCESTRSGFGRGLCRAGENDENVVALCADLTESTQMHAFAEQFGERFLNVGIAEQNLVTVASGMAAMGKVPFAGSYAAFSPGRNWEQIRTTICLNEQPVKIVGSHAGLSVGPDGATHQVLEDIALMRTLPGMVVVCPGDSIEAEKATLAIAVNNKPSYLRLAREASPVFITAKTPFEIGKAYVLREGYDVTLFGTGSMSYQCLLAATMLAKKGISAEVVHVPTIKPLDEKTILASITKTKKAVSAEDGQVAGGFGGALAELFAAKKPVPLERVGMEDMFGESAKAPELYEKYGLTAAGIMTKAEVVIKRRA